MIVLSLTVAIFTAYVQVVDFKERTQNYEIELLKASDEAKKSGTFAELQVPIVLPPNPLSIFSKGFDEKAGNKIIISIEDVPELESISQKKNPFMAMFINFDVVSIVKIILSLMAIFLIADTISGEREVQTLKMIFINQVSRLEFFMAKYFAALMVILIPLLVMFLFSSLYISLQSSIQLSILFWLKLIFMFLSSLLFLSIFIFIGLWISLKAPSSSQAMIYGLFIWIGTVFIYPILITISVSKVVDVPSFEEFKASVDQLYKEFGDKLIEDYEKHYPKGRTFFSAGIDSRIGFMSKNNEWIALPYKQGITSKFKLEFDAGRVRRMIPVLLEYQNRIIDKYNNYRNKQLKQKKVASWLQVLLPGYLIDETFQTLAETSYETRVISILEKTKEYRSTYINYIKSKNGFGPKYFTQIPPELWSDDYKAYENVQNIYNVFNNTYPPLNLTDIPKFQTVNRFIVPHEMFFLLLVNLILLVIVSKLFISFNVK